jgi:DNA-binding cell septation regulator SpoVG
MPNAPMTASCATRLSDEHGNRRAAADAAEEMTPHRSGALIGFCSVQLPSGIIVNDVRILTGKSGLWCAMPAQKQICQDGNPRLDGNNKPIYSPFVEFVDRATADRFGAMVLDLVRRAHPDEIRGDRR